MINSYLETLGLLEGATKAEIKSAYRQLSKQYHPDVSKEKDNGARFIAITEAYKFLSDVGPRPATIQASQSDYEYNTQADEYYVWRQKARQYAYKKNRDAVRRQKESTKYVLRVFNTLTIIMLLFNMSLELDRYLPLKISYEKILSDKINSKNMSYDIIKFKDHTMRFTPKEVKNLNRYTYGEIYSSVLHDIPVYVNLKGNGYSKRHNQDFSVIGFFSFFIKIIFLCCILYKYVFKTLDTQLSIAIFLMFMYVFQFYIFFI